MTQREIQHLYLRAGFGAPIQVVNNSLRLTRQGLLDAIFLQSAKPTLLDAVRMPTDGEVAVVSKKDMSREEKKMLRQYLKEEDKKLNLAWVKKILSGEEILNEKMTFFWHDHFACKEDNPIFAQSLNNTIRKNALGNFRTLLLGVSKEPAMLKFLNNQQNKKQAPNENFAREVLELFTLGRGHYTEEDIKNAARSFTGWGFEKVTGGFFFKEKQHDFGEKTFLGKTGTWNGEDILTIITEQKQCALFITDKIYRYFVNEKGNDKRVSDLADQFYKSNYDIAALMRSIYTADWFYDPENIGSRIKSPVELLASLGRHFEPSFSNENALFLIQRVLGQILFRPPNVAGWPNGKEWIDSSSLVFRMSLGKKMIDATEISSQPKPDDDQNPNEILKKQKRFAQIEAQINWSLLSKEISAATDIDLINKACNYLLQTDAPAAIKELKGLSSLTPDEKLKRICSAITALPEYQLC